MDGKYKKGFVLFLGMILFLTGCAGAFKKDGIAGKTYLYEKEGFGGDFTIRIESGGTFTWYEGNLSSHIGTGEWELDGNILRLQDDTMEGSPCVNYFEVDGDTLIFQSEHSDNFIFIKVSDGEKFSAE